MMNASTLAALLLALAGTAAAGTPNPALRDAQRLAGGETTLGAGYDGGCTGGSCGAVTAPDCPGGRCRVERATAGALRSGGLVVQEVKSAPRSSAYGEVPAPALTADKPGAMAKKSGFFSNLFSGKGALYGLGGAAAGAGAGFLLGGPLGALIGAAVGAVAGLLLAKFLS
jgi:hypothetical protein